MRTTPLAFIMVKFYYLFRVGLCPHGNLPLQDACLHQSHRRGSQAVDRVDLSPRDHQSRHVLKNRSKWGDQRLTWQHVELFRVSDLHRTDEKVSSTSDRYRTDVILPRLVTRRGRSRSFTIGSIAWTIAIFRNRRHGVDTLQPSDFH